MMEEATMCASCLLVFVQVYNTNLSRITVVQEETQQGLQVADATVLAKRPYVVWRVRLRWKSSLVSLQNEGPPKETRCGCLRFGQGTLTLQRHVYLSVDATQPLTQAPKNGPVYFGLTRDPSETPAATSTSEVSSDSFYAIGNVCASDMSQPAPAPKFSGFSGFGTATTNPFAAAPSTPAAVPSSGSSFPFGQPSTTSSSDAPAVSSSASQATKNFASFLGSATTNGATSSEKSEQNTSDDDELLKEEVDYLSHIRGLNVSLLTTVKNAIETDPFVDVGSLLETYQSLRLSEKKKFDEKVGGMKGAPAKETEKKSTSTPAPTSAFVMPKAPGSFTFGAPPKPSGGESDGASSTASSAPLSEIKFGGSASGSSPFSFGSSSSNAPPAPSGLASPFSFAGLSAPSSSSKGSAFSALGKGRPSSEDISGESSGPSGFALASAFGKSSGKDTGTDKDKDKIKAELKSAFPTSASGSSLFGGPSASSSGTSLFGSASSTTPSAFTTPEKTFPTSSSLASIATTTTTSSSSSAPFSFSTPPKFALGAAGSGGFGGFGKPPAVGSIGNPVGFGFGSPPKDGEAPASLAAASNAPKPFVFGPPKEKQLAEEGKDGGEAKDAGDEPPPLFAGSVHDKEGEGEEEEETTHEIRSKVYKMMKDDEGKSRWAEQGVGAYLCSCAEGSLVLMSWLAGVLRVKKHKENDSRRVLLRNSSTGKVVIVSVPRTPSLWSIVY